MSQAWTGPEGSRKLRFLDFVTTAQDGGRLSALRTGRLYPQEILLVLISIEGWVDPRAIVWSEGFYVNEKSTDTSCNRTATFRFVAQHLNHCATAVPELCLYWSEIMHFQRMVCQLLFPSSLWLSVVHYVKYVNGVVLKKAHVCVHIGERQKVFCQWDGANILTFHTS